MIFNNFEPLFTAFLRDLAEILDTKFESSGPEMRSAIGRSLVAIMEFHLRGDYNHRDWNILRLALLEKQLRKVAEHRPDLMPEYRKRLLSEDPEHYMGVRFEILVASDLVSRGLPFAHPEPPDFVVYPDNQRVPLECISLTYRGGDTSKLLVKIRKGLNKKSRSAAGYVSDYGGSERLVLCADITNLFYGSNARGRLFQPREVEQYVAQRVAQLGLGGAVLFTLVLDRKRDTLEAVHFRVNGPSAPPEVTAILAECFPTSGRRILVDYLFPPTT